MQNEDASFVTDCWQAYESWMRCVPEFTQLVRLRESEVWLDDAVSVGSPTHPRVSAPFQVARRGGIQVTLERAEAVMRQLLASLMASIDAARRELGALQELKGDPRSVDALKRRIDAQSFSLKGLERAYRDAEDQPHPQALVAWLEILREHLTAGDPRIVVEVRTIRIV